MRSKISLKYVLAGAFLGFLVIHPLVMIFGQWMLEHKISWDAIIKISFKSFSLNMLPWSLAFTVLGAFIGILYSQNKQSIRNLSEARNELEIRVEERTSELVKANKELRIEITERKNIEEALKKEKDKAQKYLDIAGVMVVVIDADQNITLINKKGCEILGCKENEVIGKNWFDNFLPERIRRDVIAVFEKLMAGEVEPVEYYENPVLTKRGEERIIAWHNTVIKDDSGKIIYTIGSGEDITERRMEEADRVLLLDNMSALVWYLKDEQTHGAVNKALADFMGLQKSDIEHKSLFEIYRREEAEVSIAGNHKVFAEKKSINTEEWVVNANGESRLLAITKIPRLAEDGSVDYMVCSAVDITERMLAEELLIQAKQDWEDTFNTITDMIFINDKDFNIIRANKAAYEMLGLPDLEINKTIKCYEYCHGKDGPLERCPALKCLKTEKPATYEMFEPRLNKIVEIKAIPKFDENNQIEGFVHIVRDLTKQRNIEEELIRSQKLSSLGRMLAGISHEIKNPLTGIKMMLESVRDDYNMKDSSYQDIMRIINEIIRLDNLLDNLMKFSKPKPLDLDKKDIGKSIENSLILISKDIKEKKIRIKKVYRHNGTKILIDSERMQQVFINLLLNAAESMDKNGVLSIYLYEIKNGQINGTHNKYTDLTEYIPKGMDSGIHVRLKDSGCGIKKENLRMIFDPFYSSRDNKTGLGLYITHEIVHQHKGSIHVNSTEGMGTTFNIILPNLS